jgi:Holliday junction resolvase RusA-like endonuclease
MIVMTIQVPGIPVGKGRPRMSVRGGHAMAYTPEKTVRYENLVRTTFVNAYPDAVPLDVPVKVIVDAEFPIPKSWSKKKRKDAFYVTKKPDIDNIIKSVFDGLNGVAWTDDAMVSIVEARKKYTDQMPACYITITTLEEKNE